MVIKKFPAVENADKDGLLALGGDLEVETLLNAYRHGIFPWPLQRDPILWFAPPKRAILDFTDFKIPKRLRRYLSQTHFQFRVDKNFEQVITECARMKGRRAQVGTWITPRMVQAYLDFHDAGYAHSFETYNQEGKLVGGMYGVWIGRFFAGESMFFREDHASKFALTQAVAYLKERGVAWMDIQMMTPLLSQFGAKEIEREAFMDRLKEALTVIFL